MGHRADSSLGGLKERLGIRSNEQDDELLGTLRATHEIIERLAGRRFGDDGPIALTIRRQAFPFVPLPDLHTGTFAHQDASAIPDPIRPEMSTVLQVGRASHVMARAEPLAEALRLGGHLIAEANRTRLMTGAVLLWLAEESRKQPLAEVTRDLLDPTMEVNVPILGATIEGWWVQLTRRVFIVDAQTPMSPHLVEPLLDPEGHPTRITMVEPRLIVARITDDPVKWAMAARIWRIGDGPQSSAWRLRGLAGTLHSFGMPIVAIDDATTSEEAAAQLLLGGHWYGYLGDESAAIPGALSAAYPAAVERIRRGTGAPDTDAAATLLFERLVRPGFDLRRGAESIRRYIRKQARTIVLEEYTARQMGHPWDHLGIPERHYYRLLEKFADPTPDGRHPATREALDRMERYLELRRKRSAALDLLRLRGFSDAAARKHVQRKGFADLRIAEPRSRGRRPG